MSSSLQPNSGIPKPLPDDDDDVSWALQTAAVQWGRGAHQDAIVWLRRAAESAIEKSAWSRAADLNATAVRLEKQVKQPTNSGFPTPSGMPSAFPAPSSSPPRNAILPSLPTRPSSTIPAMRSDLPGARQTTGYSSLPPLPSPSAAPSSLPASGRSSVVIDVEEGEVELSDEEIRELESSESFDADVPDGARPSVHAAVHASPEQLPAFDLESSRPLPSPASARTTPVPRVPTRSLPAFPIEPSARPPAAETGSPPRSSAHPSLPAFPLDTAASSIPPVSKWPRMGSPGTSHLPPQPGLPTFEAAPPSRPFVDDGEDGAPGIEGLEVLEPLEHEPELEQQPLELEEEQGQTYQLGSPSAQEPSGYPRQAKLDDLELVEVQRPRHRAPPSRSSVPLRPARSAPLPPAASESRQPSAKPAMPRGEQGAAISRPSVPTSAVGASRGPAHARPPGTSPIEPRMPVRTLSYTSPLNFKSEPPTTAVADRSGSTSPAPAPISDSRIPSNAPISDSRIPSNAPTIRKLEAAEPTSGYPPPSARSLEPEDLPTVSSPSLSSRPPDSSGRDRADRAESEKPRQSAERSESRILSSPPAERKRISFKFEERKQSERPVPTETGMNEPPAVMPPVSGHPSSRSPASADDVVLYGVRLSEVRGFSDLPASAHRMLAQSARIERLATGEEASFFSVALVLEGWVGLMPAIADSACATAVVGEVVFTEGTLADGLMLRVVAGQDDVMVATWDSQAIAEATRDCPWLADDFKLLADGFQALAGACLGPLGDRLDDSLRSIVTSRCEIRTLLPGEQLCAAGKPVPGMHIIGGGEIELVDDSARVAKTFGTGEFLYAPQVLAGGTAPLAARAGSKGALVLFAPRMAAHELLVSVPPLLEILAE